MDKMDKKTILVVDDVGNIRYLLKEFLTIAGFNVLLFENGNLAIPYISKADLLITDFKMTGMNGADLTIVAKLKKPDMPVIIITGDPGDIPTDHLADKVIVKPFGLEQLREIIADLLKEEREGGCYG